MNFATALSLLLFSSFGNTSINALDIDVSIPVIDDKGSPVKRSAIVHLPPGLERDKGPVPLVINIHGLLSSSQGQKDYTKFDELADNTKEFIVAFPQGQVLGEAPKSWVDNPVAKPFYDLFRSVIGGALSVSFVGNDGFSWNAGGCCGSASTKRIDEIKFLRQLIVYIQEIVSKDQNFELDVERIYVTGMSNGGFMTHRVACEMSDVIAAAASVAGPMMDNRYKKTDLGFLGDDSFECKPENLMPLLQIHSVKDAVVPFNGSPLLGFPSVAETISFWRGHNKVDESNTNVVTSVTKKTGPSMLMPIFPFSRRFTTTCTRYETSEKDPNTAVVELCEHDSDVFFGHCWPSVGEKIPFQEIVKPSELATFTCLNGLGNEYIWNFLKQHSRKITRTNNDEL